MPSAHRLSRFLLTNPPPAATVQWPACRSRPAAQSPSPSFTSTSSERFALFFSCFEGALCVRFKGATHGSSVVRNLAGTGAMNPRRINAPLAERCLPLQQHCYPELGRVHCLRLIPSKTISPQNHPPLPASAARPTPSACPAPRVSPFTTLPRRRLGAAPPAGFGTTCGGESGRGEAAVQGMAVQWGLQPAFCERQCDHWQCGDVERCQQASLCPLLHLHTAASCSAGAIELPSKPPMLQVGRKRLPAAAQRRRGLQQCGCHRGLHVPGGAVRWHLGSIHAHTGQPCAVGLQPPGQAAAWLAT